jgi:hypothetical protein
MDAPALFQEKAKFVKRTDFISLIGWIGNPVNKHEEMFVCR